MAVQWWTLLSFDDLVSFDDLAGSTQIIALSRTDQADATLGAVVGTLRGLSPPVSFFRVDIGR
jgi:hypothetical protein